MKPYLVAALLGFILVFTGCGEEEWKGGPQPYTGLTLVTGNTTRVITDELIEAVEKVLPEFIKLTVMEEDFEGIENANQRQPDRDFGIFIGSVPDDLHCGLHRSGDGYAYACVNEPRSGLWRIGALVFHETGHGCGIGHTPNTFISGEGNQDSRYSADDKVIRVKGIGYYQWQLDALRECFPR